MIGSEPFEGIHGPNHRSRILEGVPARRSGLIRLVATFVRGQEFYEGQISGRQGKKTSGFLCRARKANCTFRSTMSRLCLTERLASRTSPGGYHVDPKQLKLNYAIPDEEFFDHRGRASAIIQGPA